MTRLSECQLASGWAAGSERPHECVCGSLVDTMGSHALSCKHGSGRLARHHSVNDLIHRALTRVNIPAIKEPKGLLTSDNKRPDGYSLIPWHAGRNLTWDVFNHQYGGSIVPSTFVHSRRWSSRDGIGKEDGKICRIVHNILLLSDNHGNFRSFQ